MGAPMSLTKPLSRRRSACLQTKELARRASKPGEVGDVIICSDLVRGLEVVAWNGALHNFAAAGALVLHHHGAVIRARDCDLAGQAVFEATPTFTLRAFRSTLSRERIDPAGRSEISKMEGDMSEEGARRVRFLPKRSLCAAVSLAALVCAAPAFAASCEDLASLKLTDTTIETAETIPAGDYTTPDKVTRKGMPAFCRVTASVKGAPDSDIRIEMWLPKEGWTGVFHSNGNGGYGGIFDLGYPGMEAAVKRGYASANTDMGTAPSNSAQRRSAHRPSAEMEGLGKPFDPCDDGRRQGYRQGFLWRSAEAFLLHRLLDRRPAGAHRSGILSRTTTTAFSSARRS